MEASVGGSRGEGGCFQLITNHRSLPPIPHFNSQLSTIIQSPVTFPKSLLTELNFCYFPRFMQKPEAQAREKIDALLEQCGWILQNRSTINLSAGRGIAIREGLLKGGEAAAFG